MCSCSAKFRHKFKCIVCNRITCNQSTFRLSRYKPNGSRIAFYYFPSFGSLTFLSANNSGNYVGNIDATCVLRKPVAGIRLINSNGIRISFVRKRKSLLMLRSQLLRILYTLHKHATGRRKSTPTCLARLRNGDDYVSACSAHYVHVLLHLNGGRSHAGSMPFSKCVCVWCLRSRCGLIVCAWACSERRI